MTRLIAFVLTLCISILSNAQDSVSVLFIGNSYTYVNAMPDILVDIATSLGDVVNQDSQTAGGATLQNHAGNPLVYTAVNSQPWDFVVLQGQSQEPSFSDTQVDAETIPYAKQLSDSVYANKFCSDVLFFMTWGRENGDPQWAPISTFEGMNGRLRNAYLRMSDTVQGAVSPVGVAWKRVRDNNPTIQLYAGDGSHPSYAGSYLAACTFYASVFRKSPSGATFIGSLDPTTAAILQDAASFVVLDSLSQWNLRPISEHTQAEFSSTIAAFDVAFENSSTKAQSYVWDFGDGNNSTDEHPTHSYAVNGSYTVKLIANSPCDSDTITELLELGVFGIDELGAKFKLASHGNGSFTITSEMDLVSVQVIDPSGRTVAINYPSANSFALDLSQETKGIYSVLLETEAGRFSYQVLR